MELITRLSNQRQQWKHSLAGPYIIQLRDFHVHPPDCTALPGQRGNLLVPSLESGELG